MSQSLLLPTVPKRQKRHLRWAACALVLGLSFFGVFLALRGSPGLLDRSTQVQTALNWYWYDWTSDTELLVVPTGLADKVIRIDTRTGPTSEFKAHGDEITRVLLFTINGVSPDKRWIHCNGVVGHVSTHEFFTLTGERRSYVDNIRDEIGAFHGAWSSDSRSWVFLHREDAYLRFGELTVDGPKSKREFRVKPSAEFSQPYIERILQNGNILVSEGVRALNPVQTFQLFEYDLKSRKLVRTYAIPLPFTTDIGQSAVSPAGDRIAFFLERSDPPTGLAALLNRLMHRKPGPVMSLWVAQLDGSRLQSLGSEALRVDRTEGVEQGISDLRWLPDGKRLSFIFRDSLWTVPIN